MRDRIRQKLADLRDKAIKRWSVSTLRRENAVLQEELDQCLDLNDDLVKQLVEAKNKIEQLAEKNKELDEKLESLKLKLKPEDTVKKKFGQLMDYFD